LFALLINAIEASVVTHTRPQLHIHERAPARTSLPIHEVMNTHGYEMQMFHCAIQQHTNYTTMTLSQPLITLSG